MTKFCETEFVLFKVIIQSVPPGLRGIPRENVQAVRWSAACVAAATPLAWGKSVGVSSKCWKLAGICWEAGLHRWQSIGPARSKQRGEQKLPQSAGLTGWQRYLHHGSRELIAAEREPILRRHTYPQCRHRPSQTASPSCKSV